MRSTDISVRIGEIYALPLFELATESDCVETVEQDLSGFMEVLQAESKFDRFLASPQFVTEDKCSLLKTLFSKGLHELTLRFLLVVIRHGRAVFFPDIVACYHAHFRALAGRTTVQVTVAKPLADGEQQSLTKDLSQALDARVDLDVIHDPSILGGTILRYDGQMVDNSVKGRLRQAVSTIMNQRKG